MPTTSPTYSPLRRLASYAALFSPLAVPMPTTYRRPKATGEYNANRKPGAKAKRRAEKAGRRAARKHK